MLKTVEEQKLEDESNKYLYLNKIIDNIKVKQQNGRLWTPYHDMQLYEYVIKYNFNFYEISNAFQRLCTNDKKYEYSEDAVRLHWAFLHSMRHFEQTPDEAYYQRMKLQYDKEKPKTFKKTVEEKEQEKLSEEEDIKRMKEEFEKMMHEKYGQEGWSKINGNNNNINDNVNNTEENTKVELDKKEKEEVEELLINETKKKKEEENNDENKEEKDLNKENNNDDNKEDETNNEASNENNKLFDENNEPEYIKQLFNKTIPQEILDKLNKDQGKYNNSSPSKPESNNNKELTSISTNTNNEPPENPENKKEITNQSPLKEIQKNNIDKEEEDLFPIKSNKQKEISEPGKFQNINMEKELQNTKDFHDYIESNPVLKKQYDQLNNYCNFAVKSINYLVNKSTGMNDTSSEEAKKIEQTNKQLNELLLQPIIKETEEKGYTLEDWNKKIEEEENKMNFETTNYDNYMKNAPKDEERENKLNKFKEHLFSFAEKISTEELLEKITGIINQNNNNSENNNNQNNIENNNEVNNNINNEVQNNNNNNNINNINNLNLEHEVQNFMNNLENNNNNEDEKSELTKEQSESVNENLTDNNGRNTVSSVGSLEFPKKYRHVYRGMVYYDDKPNPNDKKNSNNNRDKNKNKKNIQDDDEIEEDDDEDADEYNK